MNSEREICFRLRTIRKHRNLTQAELAKKVGMRQSKIAKLESGNTRLTVRDLLILADGLEVEASSLLDQSEILLVVTV